MPWKSCIPALMCLLIAIGMTGPVWVASEPSFVGLWEALDLSGSVWAHWWTADALARGANPFVGTHSYLPFGLNPVFQYNLLDAVVDAPIIWLAGPRIGYNIAVLLALTTAGLGTYFLARSTGARTGGALFAAAMVETSSAIALEAHEGRISQVMILFFVLALGFLARLLRGDESTRTTVGLGITMAATALVYWYTGFSLILVMVIAVSARWRHLSARGWCNLAVAVILSAVLTLPFVFELLSTWDALPGVTRLVDETGPTLNFDSQKSGTTIATENSRWLLWPVVGRALQEHGHQLSWLALLLCAGGLRWRTQHVRTWLMVAGVGWVLALGPVLHLYQETTTIPLPFGWLQAVVPTFERMWWPQRFEVLTAIGCAIAGGHALDHWMQSKARKLPWLIGALAVVLTEAPFRSGVIPLAISPVPPSLPELYSAVDGAALTTPVFPSVMIANRLLWSQTLHGKPTQNGDGEHIPSHRPAGFTDWMKENSLVGPLATLVEKGTVTATVTPAGINALIEAGFSHVVVDPSVYSSKGRQWAAAHGAIFQQLWGKPERMERGGATWTILPIQEPVEISARLQRGRSRRAH
jgi:hypothetical protein